MKRQDQRQDTPHITVFCTMKYNHSCLHSPLAILFMSFEEEKKCKVFPILTVCGPSKDSLTPYDHIKFSQEIQSAPLEYRQLPHPISTFNHSRVLFKKWHFLLK